ncbi:hypothetical protein ACET3Z_029959 [Daucus carota]
MDDKGKRLYGKVAVITGGTNEIGAATAKLFAENGAYVVIADTEDELGARLAESIGGQYIHCDVSQESEVESAVKLAYTWKGRLDIMFNNASIPGPQGSITTLSIDQFSDLLSVNINGIVHGIKHASQAMIAAGKGGSIICTSSSAALVGGLGAHSYTLSKEAIFGVVRSSSCELGVHGIRVNCLVTHSVTPEMEMVGYKDPTEMNGGDSKELTRTSLLQGRSGTAEDVAFAAVFLASDRESGFITGHNLVIDGGYTSGCSHLHFTYTANF